MGSPVQVDAVAQFCDGQGKERKTKRFFGWGVWAVWPCSASQMVNTVKTGGVHVLFKDGAGLSERACCEHVQRSMIFFFFADPLEAFLSGSGQFGYQPAIRLVRKLSVVQS